MARTGEDDEADQRPARIGSGRLRTAIPCGSATAPPPERGGCPPSVRNPLPFPTEAVPSAPPSHPSSIHDGVHPLRSTFLRFFGFLAHVFQSHSRVIHRWRGDIIAESGVTNEVGRRTPRTQRNPDTRERRPVLAALFVALFAALFAALFPVARVTPPGVDADGHRAHHRDPSHVMRLTSGPSSGPSSGPEALGDGNHPGVMEGRGEGRHREHVSGQVGTLCASHCLRQRGRHRSGTRSSGGSETRVRSSGTGSGDPGGGGDPTDTRHRGEKGKGPVPAV